MSKLPIVPLAFGFTFAIICGALGQGLPYNANASKPTNDGMSLPGQNASPTGPAPTGNNAADDEDDPTLQRLRTKDSLGEMLSNEGQLTAKVRRREKISKVESTKQLPTSGTDPKFQGSLLHSSLTSIQDVGAKTNTAPAAPATSNAENADSEPMGESDPRFKAKRLVFTPMSDDESKKKELPRTKADTSSSPSPSPSASPTPSSH
ncbi:MAG TPA: hypothetical protein VLK27_04225 [Chthoniobacterales bacterium]|nr:hypothetical protein [Chthoniobacterales bacterium]